MARRSPPRRAAIVAIVLAAPAARATELRCLVEAQSNEEVEEKCGISLPRSIPDDVVIEDLAVGAGRIADAHAITTSSITRVDAPVARHVHVVLLLPVAAGALDSGHRELALGNVEIALRYVRAPMGTTRYAFELGTSLPTAPGALGSVSYAIHRAAMLARGYEHNELFDAERVGTNVRFTLDGVDGRLDSIADADAYRWRYGVSLALHNLVTVTDSPRSDYTAEIVPAAYLGYSPHPRIALVARAWMTWQAIGSDDDSALSVAVEPRIEAHLGVARPSIGVVLPVTGPAADAHFASARFAVAVGF